jgi:methanogenic corrinoid protein MtbC1
VYTVKHAAAMTGIPADTLRMWERRYGVVAPVRTESGYRLYDDAAIARLTAMHALVEAGWSPRRAAAQVASGTTTGPTDRSGDADEGGPDPVTNPSVGDSPALDLLVELALAFDGPRLNQELDRVFSTRDLPELLDGWLMPALTRLGRAWHRGEVSVAAEHFVSAGVQRRLARALDAAPDIPVDAPRVLVGLARGSRHELGVLAFAALLAHAGLAVTYVGGDCPPESWVVAVATGDPAAVVLGVSSSDDTPAVRDTVAALGAARPDLPVFLGGRHQDEVGAGRPLGHAMAAAATDLAGLLTG